MKPISYQFAILLVPTLLAIMSVQAPADLTKTPWLLNKRGSYIEMSEGFYRRAEAIRTVKAGISVRYTTDSAIDRRTLLSRSYPLSKKGLAEFKELDRARVQEAICEASILVYINGDLAGRLVSSRGDDPIGKWGAFETAALEAEAQVIKLLALASKS